MKSGYFPTINLVDELIRRCSHEETGVFMITTQKHETAQINIEEGDIVFLAFERARGVDALPFVLRIVDCRYQFTEGVRSRVHTSLPPTDWIVEHLQGRAQHLNHDGSYAALTGTQKQMIQEVLTEYVGPVAVVLCAEKLSTASNLEQAIKSLVGDLPDPQDAAVFRTDILRRLEMA